MNDLAFTLLALVLVCVTAIVLIRGNKRDLSTAERKQIRDLTERVAVLEQIVTDGGMQTAAQIEAMREPRLPRGE
jgi:preprotein translocase subunit YajC